MGLCCIINILGWATSCAFVGWLPMESELLLILIGYSVYLTLNVGLYCAYCVILVSSTTCFIYSLVEVKGDAGGSAG